MNEFLSDVIIAIDNLPEAAGVDRNQAYTEAFERFRSEYSLVDRIIEGDTTFRQEFKDALGVYGKRKLAPDHFSETERAMVKDFLEVFPYYFNQGDFRDAAYNPVVLGIAGGALGAGLSSIHEKPPREWSRRKFTGIAALGSAAFVGVVGGLLINGLHTLNYKFIEQEMQHLDDIVQEIYHT